MVKTEKATFGAGCFWGVEDIFMKMKGVTSTAVGYEGGTLENPTYEDVCSHTSGHAEVVQFEFDPKIVSYKELVKKFFSIHDPTQVNRQGPDVGSNYRSVIFCHSEEQKKIAESMKKELEKTPEFNGKKIATAIESAKEFYMAEAYHQQYFEKKRKQGFTVFGCHI